MQQAEDNKGPVDGGQAEGAAGRFVRNDANKRHHDRFTLRHAFRCAGAGIAYAFRSQRNIRLELPVAVLAIVLGAVLQIPLASWTAIIICIGLVIAAECLNTAIESIVDLVSPQYAELAKRAKDCGAACVLVCAIISLVVAAAIYINALVAIVAPGLLP